MKFKLFSLLILFSIVSTIATQLYAIGWPSKYQGVMLQGFYWDSYEDSKWKNLEADADELSEYFKLIWIPNSGRCGGYNNMGYMPQYWFTNHNSSFGTESELLSMISTYKTKGTGFIADCVINHRNGVTGWYDFPKEEWNGRTWSIGLDGICSNDEMAYSSGQPKPTGGYDTGDNFDGCRDLDHTNINVQDNCKNYVKCLKEKYGYVGMRYDMVKGYAGRYNKIYNEYANIDYSVGEYWDGNYDAVKAWIDATGKTSAAFDFPCKYQINEAFHSNDMTKLVWKANGVTDQPAGMIHFGYQQYAVTFIDNHDTYRDGSKFNGNVVAANAFILMSPGTPCVFLPHYKQYKSEIQRLIKIRNSAGLHNQSFVRVLRSTQDCYMAEVSGLKGNVVVKIGPAMISPDGYLDSDIVAAGSDYCVWTKVKVQEGGDDPIVTEIPESLYVIGEVDGHTWSPSLGTKMEKYGNEFKATIELKSESPAATNAYFSLCKTLATGNDWDSLNKYGNRFAPSVDTPITPDGEGAKFSEVVDGDAKAFYAHNGKYEIIVDWINGLCKLKNIQSNNIQIPCIEGITNYDTEIIYNLQGNIVDNPQNGIYIRIKNGKSEKVVF